METGTVFILFIILTAFVFDFINGFHDAANSIATIVVTRVLTPKQAVIWAAFFNFIAFLCFNLMVAKTIGDGLVDARIITPPFIFSALIGAITWNLFSWYFGLPSSSSHALIGGLTGSALLQGGVATLKVTGFVKVAIGIFVSPILGLIAGILLTFAFTHCLQNTRKKQLNRAFKGLQLISSALLSMTHASNDAQKTMGIIAVLLFSTAWIEGDFYVPLWVVISCQLVISLGTLAGGWRIVHTMGRGITQLNAIRGCAAESGAAAIIFAATDFGIPVSTTQTVAGSITGVGLHSGIHGVQWRTIQKIFLSWLITLPASALVSAACLSLLHLIGSH